jgi:hypothetical protein
MSNCELVSKPMETLGGFRGTTRVCGNSVFQEYYQTSGNSRRFSGVLQESVVTLGWTFSSRTMSFFEGTKMVNRSPRGFVTVPTVTPKQSEKQRQFLEQQPLLLLLSFSANETSLVLISPGGCKISIKISIFVLKFRSFSSRRPRSSTLAKRRRIGSTLMQPVMAARRIAMTAFLHARVHRAGPSVGRPRRLQGRSPLANLQVRMVAFRSNLRRRTNPRARQEKSWA